MRNTSSLVIAAVLGLVAASTASAQATQTMTFQVDAINQISVSGTPGALAITTATAGSAPTAVTDATTTWAVTTNQTNSKVTAAIDLAMPTGVTLSLDMQNPTAATSATVILGTVAADAVTGITMLNEAGKTVTYTLNATSAAGVVASTSRTVSLTIVAGT
jgi:hypothetical protein